MPLATTMTYEITTDACAKDAPETRPVLICRYLNGLQSLELDEMMRFQDGQEISNDAYQKSIYGALAFMLCGWRNVPSAESPREFPARESLVAALREIVTPIEADHLLSKAFAGQVPDALRKKNSDSQSPASGSPENIDPPADARTAEPSDVRTPENPSPSAAPPAMTEETTAAPVAEEPESSI